MNRFHTNRAILFFLVGIFFFSSYTPDNNKVKFYDKGQAAATGYSCNNTETVKTNVAGINDLVQFSKKVQFLHVADADRGGDFELVHNGQMQNDNGLVFPAEAFGADWHWVRAVKKEDPASIKWFGAKGLGLEHYKEDSAALVNAIASIAKKNGGKLYIPAADSYYGFNGNGIVLPDNIEIYGDGPKSEIKHVNPESGTYYIGVIFYTSTYGPTASLSVVRIPSYPLQEVAAGQNYIVFKNAAKAGKMQTGTVIGLGAKKFFKNNDPKEPRYGQFELNEITKLSADTVFLKYPTTTAFESLNNAAPVLIDINGKHTYNAKLNADKAENIDDRVTKNIYIHDLKLSQADHNMINNTPYNKATHPSNLIALGGTFESKFKNLVLDGYGTFGGNMWDRCEISNLQITSSTKLLDLGYGSCNTVIHDIKWNFRHSKADTTSTLSLVYLNEGSHHIEIYNVEAGGDWSGRHLLQINGGANNLNLHDITINLPLCKAPKNYGILIKDDDDNIYVHDITIKNMTFNIGTIGQYIRLAGDAKQTSTRNIVFENIKFRGNAVLQDGFSVFVNNFNNIRFKDIDIPEGNIYLSDVQGGVVDGLQAPNSIVVCPTNANGKGNGPQILRSNVKGTNNKENKKKR